MKLILPLAALLCANAFGAAPVLTFTNYIPMQEALAKDDFKAAMTAHQTLCSKDLTTFKAEYKDCKKSFKNIEELRKSFLEVSKIFLANGDKKELKTLMTVHCPMYPGTWVQKTGSIANPYYGKSMLECGEQVK